MTEPNNDRLPLAGANLRGTDLSGTKLEGADLTDAILPDDLTGADINDTTAAAIKKAYQVTRD